MLKRSYTGAFRRDGISISRNVHTKQPKVQLPGAYLRCVIDPEHNSPVVIPDLASYPTSVFTVAQEIPISINVGNCAGIMVTHKGGQPAYRLEAAGSTDAILTYDAPLSFNSNANIAATFAATRLVACSVRIEFQGNDQNNQGAIAHFSGSRADTVNSFASPFPTSDAALRNCHDAYFGPAKDGSIGMYRPSDSASFLFVPTLNAPVANWFNTPYDFTLEGSSGSAGLDSFQIIHISGADSNAKFCAYVTMHYEAVSRVPSGAVMNVIEDSLTVTTPGEDSYSTAVLNFIGLTGPATEAARKIISDNAKHLGVTIATYLQRTGAAALIGILAAGTGASLSMGTLKSGGFYVRPPGGGP